MKNNTIIKFTKHRFLFFTLSLLVIVGGIAGLLINDGLNLGIDFEAGLSQRIQIAEQAMSVSYSGADDVVLNVVNGDMVIEIRNEDGVERTTLSSDDYVTFDALAAELQGFDDVTVSVIRGDVSSSNIATGLGLPFTLSAAPSVINAANSSTENYISIDEVREALNELSGSLQVQIVGDAYLQEFQIRVATDSEGTKEDLEAQIFSLIEGSFGTDNVIVKQSDYVGPKFSNLLTYRSIIMVVVALALIMAYIWIRFHFASALAAIAALTHDILIMIGFIAVFRLEVTTTTIAAVLTIIGYSLNDTIVVFDRIRENAKLLRGTKFERVVNISITQSLSRTLITSFTTLLAVLPLFIFAKGTIQLFALNLIVGIVVGTYSSIFIASPVLLALTNARLKRKAKHLGKDPDAILAEEVEAESGKGAPSLVKEIEITSVQRKLKGKRKK
ncbi:MAG: protein translocase subunit SecF [Bacteroidetes bacterium]|nr:protein translocase subunit SecF [Bacteroidota bacterium]